MFGLFSRNKAEKAELAALEAEGAAQSHDPVKRRQHAHLVRFLHGEAAALPFYDAIIADFPTNQRSALDAALLRLLAGDPAGVAQMEAVALARPSTAVSAYGHLIQYFQAQGDVEAAKRNETRYDEAIERRHRTLTEQRFEDPGGPLEPPRYSEQERAFIGNQLRSARKVEQVLAGSRRLDDGAVQHVLLPFPPSPDAAAATAAVASHFGEFAIYPLDPAYGWILDQLMQFEDGRIYP